MSLVTITLHNKHFQLACSEGAEKQLFELADILNEKIVELKKTSPNASFELILVMACLSAENELQTLKKKIGKGAGVGKNDNEDEKFSETLSTIAGYLENLAQKLGK